MLTTIGGRLRLLCFLQGPPTIFKATKWQAIIRQSRTRAFINMNPLITICLFTQTKRIFSHSTHLLSIFIFQRELTGQV
jgi:hypothetical protein